MAHDPNRRYEFRCPIYGFIELIEAEIDVINHPAFQRLRRIKQLAWTDYIYPGAMHTRFEHSLGVMHMASLLFDGIKQRSRKILESEYYFTDGRFERDRQIVRLAALLHDVGHSPFSHAAEDLMPINEETKRPYRHEDYSVSIIKEKFQSVIDNHPHFSGLGIKAKDVADLIEGNEDAEILIFWRDLITGQLDADRIDYLLRDSHHAGVNYGKFDWQRLVQTVVAVPKRSVDLNESRNLGVSEGGLHAAEGLILARYFMFTQVYYHKTRVAYDIHCREALRELLPKRKFPSPELENIQNYLEWDDWRVLGLISHGKGGEHARRIRERNHYRLIYETSDAPSDNELEKFQQVKELLGDLVLDEATSEKSWYKIGGSDIPIISNNNEVKPLSFFSPVVSKITITNKAHLFVDKDKVDEAKQRIARAEL